MRYINNTILVATTSKTSLAYVTIDLKTSYEYKLILNAIKNLRIRFIP